MTTGEKCIWAAAFIKMMYDSRTLSSDEPLLWAQRASKTVDLVREVRVAAKDCPEVDDVARARLNEMLEEETL